MIKMTLKRKITSLTMGVLILVLMVIILMSMSVLDSRVRESLNSKIQDIATVVANTPIIQDELAIGNKDSLTIQNYVEKIRLKTTVYFITVMDMEGVRYSHPLPQNIGRKFLGGDHYQAIWHGERYVSEGRGHLGDTIRAFEPVYKDGIRVGAVCVGVYKGDLQEEVRGYLIALIPVFVLAMIITIISSKLLANNIKKAIFGLEPEEIAVLLREKESIINNMNEGLIAVDRKGDVSLINSRAKEILEIKNESEIDEKIIKELLESIYRRGRIVNEEIRLKNDAIIMANFYTLIGENGETLGAITSFQDLTVVHNMAEELTGVKELTWTLRAQNHEFMNKLHTLAGLIQLEEYDEALDYIFKTSSNRGFLTEILKQIKEPGLQGLIFAKYNKADEAKIKFELDDESYLNNIPSYLISQEILTIVGNLLENSIEELRNRQDGWINLKITQDDKIKIVVKNNGRTIDDELRNKIFGMGYSTKGDNRGFGLYNVTRIVSECHGEIKLTSDSITTWEVTI
ncbi:MAG: ATP-binding protein [Clostridium sp.]